MPEQPRPLSDAGTDAEKPLRRRRWPRRLLMALGLLLAARAMLPHATEWGIEWQLPKSLGRVVEVDGVDFELLRGSAVMDGLRVGGPLPFEGAPGSLAPDAVLASLRRASVELGLSSLLRGEIHIRSLALEGPSLRLERMPDGRLAQLILAAEPPESEEPEPDPAEPGGPEPWPIQLDSLEIRDTSLELLEPGADEARLLQFTVAAIALSDLEMRGPRIVLGDLAFSEPSVRVRREIALGRKPITLGAEPPETEAKDAATSDPLDSPPRSYEIGTVAIERFDFTILTDQEPLQAAAGFSLRDASLEPNASFPVEVYLEVGGGRIDLAGEVSALPPAFRGTLKWTELDFPLITLGLGLELPARVDSMRGSGDLDIDLRLADAGSQQKGAATVSGMVRADALELHHEETGTRVSLAVMELGIDELFAPLPNAEIPEPGPGRFVGSYRIEKLELRSESQGFDAQIDEIDVQAREIAFDLAGHSPPLLDLAAIEIRGPRIGYVRGGAASPGASGEAGSTEDGASTERPPNDPSEEPGGKPFALSVARLEVQGGAVEFTDRTTRPDVRSAWRDLSISARELRLPAREMKSFRLTARGPGSNRLNLEGSLGQDSAALEVVLTSLGLPRLEPYATRVGYRIKDGALDLRSSIGLRGETVDVSSQLALHRLDLASNRAGDFEGRFGLSLDLAVALLQDASGTIELPVSFSAQRGEIRAKLLPTVLAALRRAITGAALLPLKGLRQLAGTIQDRGLGELGATPGSVELVPGSTRQVQALGELLANRPQLGLALQGRAGPADEPALATRILVRQVQEGGELPPLDDVGFLARRRIRKALLSHGSETGVYLDGQDRADLQRYVKATAIPEDDRIDLARRRATALRDLLIESYAVEPSRLRVMEADAGAPGVIPQLIAAAQADDAVSPGSVPSVGSGPSTPPAPAK